jgi:hypothetical protein
MYDKAVSFRDLDFHHEFRWITHYDGRRTQRWVPIGMPRIGHELERSVFFLFQRDWKTSNYTGPWGTGFFVCRRSETIESDFHWYAVTNKHVAREFSDIRINDAGGDATFWEYDPSEWVSSQDDDLAAVDVTDRLPWSEDRGYNGAPISCVMEHTFVSQRLQQDYDIGIGDQTIMLGLFTEHDGGKKNVPVGRFGFVAATPSVSSPISLGVDGEKARPSWLNDTHSRYGFSGSPVWVWRSKYDDLRAYRDQASGYWPEMPRESFLFLLGCHRGQFREDTKIYAAEGRKLIQSGDDIEIPGAMTVVVPAWSISELLNDPKLTAQRAARESSPERQRRSVEIAKAMRRQE